MHNNSLKWAKKAAEQGHQEAQKWIASHSDPIKQTAGRAVNRTEEDYRKLYGNPVVPNAKKQAEEFFGDDVW